MSSYKIPQILIIYLLTPRRSVPLVKLTDFAANQEIPRILWNSKLHYRTNKSPPLVPIQNQIHLVPTTHSHILNIHLNIILPSTSFYTQWSLTLRFPHQTLGHISLPPYVPRAQLISFFSNLLFL
jgi:hypothetical protein